MTCRLRNGFVFRQHCPEMKSSLSLSQTLSLSDTLSLSLSLSDSLSLSQTLSLSLSLSLSLPLPLPLPPGLFLTHNNAASVLTLNNYLERSALALGCRSSIITKMCSIAWLPPPPPPPHSFRVSVSILSEILPTNLSKFSQKFCAHCQLRTLKRCVQLRPWIPTPLHNVSLVVEWVIFRHHKRSEILTQGRVLWPWTNTTRQVRHRDSSRVIEENARKPTEGGEELTLYRPSSHEYVMNDVFDLNKCCGVISERRDKTRYR